MSRACCRCRDRLWVLIVPSLAFLAGCGSGRIEEARTDVPGRVTASADPSRPATPGVMAVPDVITKPKPFRLPDVIGAVPSLEPVTMAPRTGIVAVTQARAETPPLEFPSDRPAVAEVAAMLRGYLQAFNRHDAAALAAHWSPTAESVDLDSGETTRGRAAVEAVFATLFEEDAAAAIDIDVESIRPLRDDVAVVDGVSRIVFAESGSAADVSGPASPVGSRFSAVVVKRDGRWLLESVREASLAAPATPVAARPPLEPLAWLVGSWEDVGEGVTAGTQCFWSPGRAFLVRSHVVTIDAPAVRPASGDDSVPGLLPPGTSPGGTRRELTEIIGWDADRGCVRSWLFTSDGRFAEATWAREGDAWRVHYEGGGPDASLTGSLHIARLGPDEVSIRCDDDALADVMPPACDFVRTARLGAVD